MREINRVTDLRAGDQVLVVLPGVKEWSIPATEHRATVTDDNYNELLNAIGQDMDMGGASVYVEEG